MHKKTTTESISIPYDMHESHQELLIVMPLGGVSKESVEIKIRDHTLTIIGTRQKPNIRNDYEHIIKECYRGPIHCILQLPPNLRYNNIHSSLSKDNILTIIIPKNIIPDRIDITIE